MSQLTTPSDPDVPPPPIDPGTPQPAPDEVAGTDSDSAADAPDLAPDLDERVDGPPEEPTADNQPAAQQTGSLQQDGHSATPKGEDSAPRGHQDEIIIGEIPDEKDLSVMRWTARCTASEHDLLGHYDTREEAEHAGADHLASLHTPA
jgi:hypothetical protein